MNNSTRVGYYAIAVLIFCLLGRGLLLEYTDLIDPTEARYATVSQEMALSGDWVTPKLPLPEGLTPYLGKPPLHFWLTAICYEIFGVDEWTSRLPSFIATLLTTIILFYFTKFRYNIQTAMAACLIFISSGLAFFLAGASVTDVTLNFTICASVILTYLGITNPPKSYSYFLFAATFGSLAFLTKGPVGIALIAAPFFLWSLSKKDFTWLKSFPWISSTSVFIAICAPWFYLNEKSNPGFFKYFFWNENIARYLFKQYGDQYGSGHVHNYGTSWVMLFVSFMPWTLILLACLFQNFRKKSLNLLNQDDTTRFVVFWAISTPLFFTFVRQLHAMYLLPAIVPFSILTAVLFLKIKITEKAYSNCRYLGIFSLILILGLISAGAILKYSSMSLLLSSLPILFGVMIFRKFDFRNDNLGVISTGALIISAIYLSSLIIITPYVNSRRSSEEVLRTLEPFAGCVNGDGSMNVGVSSRNSYSHYWSSKNWENELVNNIKIQYVSPPDADQSDICFYLYKGNSKSEVPKNVTSNMKFIRQNGDWLVFQKDQ